MLLPKNGMLTSTVHMCPRILIVTITCCYCVYFMSLLLYFIDSSSRPGSRKASATPKKMSKKDQEAQQAQLLEQQKQLEQQRREEEERLTALWREKVEKIKAENQVQQLNVSTAAGLHIHCRVVPSPQGGDTPLLSIHQMYPIKTAGTYHWQHTSLHHVYSFIIKTLEIYF